MERPDPPYRRIVIELRRRISAGELPPGARVPSTRQITRDWGVAMATATKVLAALRDDGVVTTCPGVGTIVAAAPSRPAKRREVREAELSRERIVWAAVRIADAEGLGAVSMRRIASGLGVATMALYRHVDTKDELVLEMADVVLGEVALPAVPPEGWRAQLELMAGLQWALFRRHPWLVQALSETRPPPNLTAQADWAIRALDGHGLTSSTVLYSHVTLFNHVRTTALSFEGDSYPSPVAVVTRGEIDVDELFGFGLQRLLDGFATLIARTQGQGR